jgi:hypothetical protein
MSVRGMKAKSSSFTAAILVSAALSGCGHHHVNPTALPYVDRAIWVEPTSDCSESSPKALPKFRASDTLSGNTRISDPQAHSAWLARRVPGGVAFGHTFDDNHRPIVRLTDPTKKHAALIALDSLGASTGRSYAVGADSVVAVRVRWDFAELYDWMQYLMTEMSAARGLGINSGAIDTRNDRIEFGVVKRESLTSVVNWLIEQGIPCGLVAVRVTGPIYGI